MGAITQAVMVQADRDVRGMSQAQKVSLADEIFAQQPNMLASVLALPRMGVGMVELEVPLHILLVTFQAMKRSGRAWPVVSEEVQEICLQRLTARADQVVQQFCDDHPERFLLAFVYGYLGDHDLLRVRTDAEKFLVLAALNLVECVAFVGSTTSS
jgi:acyl-CoA hydrolase